MGSIHQGWRKLNVAVVGGGIGGMSVAIALRRAGHDVTIYERADFVSEVGASVSCAANGTRWLHEWDVDVAKGDPVVLKKLINRDWKTGEPVSVCMSIVLEEQSSVALQRQPPSSANLANNVQMISMTMSSAGAMSTICFTVNTCTRC